MSCHVHIYTSSLRHQRHFRLLSLPLLSPFFLYTGQKAKNSPDHAYLECTGYPFILVVIFLRCFFNQFNCSSYWSRCVESIGIYFRVIIKTGTYYPPGLTLFNVFTHTNKKKARACTSDGRASKAMYRFTVNFRLRGKVNMETHWGRPEIAVQHRTVVFFVLFSCLGIVSADNLQITF